MSEAKGKYYVIQQKLNEIIDSAEFESFCSHNCALMDEGCQAYCPFTLFKKWLENNT